MQNTKNLLLLLFLVINSQAQAQFSPGGGGSSNVSSSIPAGIIAVGGPSTGQIQSASSSAQTAYTLAGRTGTVTSQTAYNTWGITSDQLDCTASGSCDGWQLNFNVDGNSVVKGARQAFNVKSIFNGPSNSSSSNRFYVAGTYYQDCFGNDNGDGGTSKGNCYALNPVARLHSDATFWSGIGGMEIDVSTSGANTIGTVLGASFVKFGTMSGALFDTALSVAAGPTSTGWGNALFLRNGNGSAPLATTGCVVCTDGSANTIAKGIDLSSYTISGMPITMKLKTPVSSTDTCTSGGMEWDANFLYICTATNNWKRVSLTAF